jgi:hypothetical protein
MVLEVLRALVGAVLILCLAVAVLGLLLYAAHRRRK